MGLKAVAGANGVAAITGGTITGITDLAVADGGTGGSTAQAAARNLGAPYVLSQASIAFIKAATGSMGNNGALTLGTALAVTYSEGCYIHLPASAISAGSTAGWYWCVMSSTTVGTVYNSTYTTGTPVAGTATAFATTGPGAFTGETTEIAAIRFSVPANSMGAMGRLECRALYEYTSNANNHTCHARLGGTSGTQYLSNTQTNTVRAHCYVEICNKNNTSVQSGGATVLAASVANGGAVTRSTLDTTSAQEFVLAMTTGTATDNMVLEDYCLQVTN